MHSIQAEQNRYVFICKHRQIQEHPHNKKPGYQSYSLQAFFKSVPLLWLYHKFLKDNDIRNISQCVCEDRGDVNSGETEEGLLFSTYFWDLWSSNTLIRIVRQRTLVKCYHFWTSKCLSKTSTKLSLLRSNWICTASILGYYFSRF